MTAALRRITPLLLVLVCLGMALMSAGDALAAQPVNFTVDTYTDSSSGNCITPHTGTCSLREAIEESNASAFAGTHHIKFDTQRIIDIYSALPNITKSVTIDGALSGDQSCGGAGQGRCIQLYGENTGYDGLVIDVSGVTINGLFLDGFTGDDIHVKSGSSDTITANVVVDAGNGIEVDSSASKVTIAGNVASHNNYGIWLAGANNTVEGTGVGMDYPGSNPTGNGNFHDGIHIAGANNTIGGTTAGARNVISSNGGEGVEVAAGSGNQILGNFIGTNAAGTTAASNGDNGVEFDTGASGNAVGGSDPEDRNIIAGNTNSGLYITGASSNQIEGNYIGLNANGAPLPNRYGVYVDGDSSGSADNVITGNVISGNTHWGVKLSSVGTNSVTGTQIISNYIGTNASGDAKISNLNGGVQLLSDNSGQTVSGTVFGATSTAQLISGNVGDGIELSGPGTTGNLIENVNVGLGATLANLGNSGDGIAIDGGANANDVLGNYLGWNARGISLTGTGTNNNHLLGNTIGTLNGQDSFGSKGDGVFIGGGAQHNQIGSETAPQSIGDAQPQGDFHPQGPGGNLFWNNGAAGVEISDASTKFNVISANSIENNTTLGILLSSGANEGQTAPVLATAIVTGGSLHVAGVASGPASTQLTIELFDSPACDSGGVGEGETYLTSFTVTASPSGTATIDQTVSSSVPTGDVITATATNASNDTSQFSNCLTVTGASTSTPTPTTSASPTPTPTHTPTPTGQTPTPTPGAMPTPSPTPSGISADANCDGVVNTQDPIAVLSQLAQVPPGAPCAAQADLNCNGHLDADDALRILDQVAGAPFPSPGGCAAE